VTPFAVLTKTWKFYKPNVCACGAHHFTGHKRCAPCRRTFKSFANRYNRYVYKCREANVTPWDRVRFATYGLTAGITPDTLTPDRAAAPCGEPAPMKVDGTVVRA
jgi:hypothetical protein